MYNVIPTSLLLVLLIRAAWIVLFFGFIQHVLLKVIRKERLHDFIEFYNPLIRNIVWVLFIINILYRLAQINPVVSLAMFGVLLALSWTSIRDFVQGTIFKLQKGDVTGQRLEVKKYSGVVKKMHNTKLELSTKNGKIIQIPYSQIISAVTIKPTATKYLKTGHVVLDLPIDSNVEEQRRQLKIKLLNSPWVISNKGVKIDFFGQNTKKQQVKIAFSTLQLEHIERVRRMLLGV